MGGALSLFAACKNPEVGACVVFYGGHPNIKPDLANLKAPVLGIYGERDGWITPQVVHDLEQKLKSLGKQIEVQMYPADHAFFNDERKEVYHPQAAADAWKRTVEFFQQNLR
jgi:carboxymethylenebutenolidase